ncbi:MAG: DNA-directed RNA polymerase subunit beta [Verrucomicrobia bacterium]|nr:DNA-directed RNA polymerase subunit beta [Verrucomicrobiota bacterium]MCH8527725.1 DNA-directed RNA polymerase subunit beta [Kiritimatiellia bacterium]
MAERTNYGTIEEVITPPNLIEIQRKSFMEFLQADLDPMKREPVGFQAVFKEIFPIESHDGQCALDFVKYEIQPAKMTEMECLREGTTYAAPFYVTFRLKDGEEVREEDIFMGEIPLMTRTGSFIINGAERVIVSQLHRSPGICFEQSTHANGSILYSYRIIPDRGSWIEVQFDTNDLINIYLDRKRRRRKFLAPTLFRAMGHGTDEELLGLYYTFEKISVTKKVKEADLINKVLKADVVDPDSQTLIARKYEPMTLDLISQIAEAGYTSIEVVDISFDEGLFLKSVEKDPSRDTEEALKDIYAKLRPGDPPSVANAKQMLKRIFGDPRRYDLGRVGRYKIRQKLNNPANPDSRVLEREDLVEATRYLLKLRLGEGSIDDIDHLGSRRVRTVGELMEGQVRVGLARTERLARERMTVFDATVEKLTPQRLVNPKAMSAVIKDFFGRSQLSQFMDQTNPLAELTHKRRMSALGPGGLSRERAGFEVRDVHTSHYGRICPIETPEGPNIGLISSLATYARVNEFGFIESPYRVVRDSIVTKDVVFLSGDDEERFIIAQANAPLDENGKFVNDTVSVRRAGEFELVTADKVTHMDVSPLQMVSVATSLIPFLEHDDANRALMGSNMQRQAVPLMVTDRPFVGTGVEARVARDSGVVVVARADGIVARVTAREVIVSRDGAPPTRRTPETEYERYEMRKFMRTNAGTCANNRPIVKIGQKVTAGQVLADGAATDQGELALGRNVLVAFMPWCGYNYEDSILLNERIVKEDVYTSIHIEEFECDARDTKLGPEEITRDIPNVGEEALKNLDHDGIIRVGAEVKPGDILVGKITPKSETELAPEERLLRAIFGEKAADVRDTSLTVPSGTFGIVMDVKIASRNSTQKSNKLTPSEKRRQAKAIHEDHKSKSSKITEDLTEALSNILLGEKIPLDVVNSRTDEIIIPANRKITKTLLRKLAAAHKHVEIDPSPIQIKIQGIISDFNSKFAELEEEYDRNMERLESGDEVDPGVVKKVKVYLASKKKLSVGDKMAGRHGNKGVVARIVPEEDMPFLPDGTPVDIVLNPLGVPSRMNIGQVLETHLGWACQKLGMYAATPVFDGVPEAEIWNKMAEAGLPEGGKTRLYDGRTGEAFEQKVVVGIIYMLKLHHLVSDKIHARAVGPYSLVTQQPLGGKAQYGGQRFGEMEVWALEAYGAAYSLQEVLTVKSDDLQGRTRIYEAIVKGHNTLEAGLPESFNVLMKEMMALGLDIQVKPTAREE